jgi:hypothetical protein
LFQIGKYLSIKEEHPENRPSKDFILFVLKCDKFNEDKDKQPLNIEYIVVTFEVSKFDIFNKFNAKQL